LPPPIGLRQDRPITDATTTDLTTTHHSVVTDDQIDHLGHMNVRFYGVNAQAGSRSLLAAIATDDPRRFVPVDFYTRHHREQLLGARLVVRSGVVDVGVDQLRLYHELANEETGTLAATFVHRVVAEEANGDRSPLSDDITTRARAMVVAIPEHGATRSISLEADPVASAPSLERVRELDLAMRQVRAVTPEECDASGTYLRSNAPMLTWAGEPVHRGNPEMLYEGPAGERMGWASMETRIAIRRLPRAGDRVQSFSAVIGLADKTSYRIQWVYEVDGGDLLTTFEIVNLAFDTGSRRPLSIPARLRAAEQSVLHEELAPRRVS
jgi:acyl-CoA thioesterase FadM